MSIWNNAAGGNWDVANNWNPVGVPGTLPTDTAIISAAGTYLVTYNVAFSIIASLDVASPGATLAFAPGDFLSVTEDVLLTAGTIDITQGSVLGAGASAVIASGGTINLASDGILLASVDVLNDGRIQGGQGLSILAAGGAIDGSGAVVAEGGTFAVLSNVAGATLKFEVSNSGSSFLGMFGTSVAPGNTFTLDGPAGGVGFAATGISENVIGMNVDAAGPSNFIDVAGSQTVTSESGTTGTTGSITLSDGDTFTLTGITNFSGAWHAEVAPSTTLGGTEVFLVCYAAGTRIGTPKGETAVEDLQIGDLVITASGAAKPIKWIGRQSYSATAVADAPQLRPVLIRADALGAGLPRRDLLVSPMHALYLDDAFIPASALVNGVSILRSESEGPVEYIHIELHDHDVLLAEGVPAESFVDDNSRTMFDNVSEYYDLYGFAERQRTFCAPRLEEGYRLEAIRRRFASRAGIVPSAGAPGEMAGHVERLHDGELEGWVMDRANPDTPVELEVRVDGEIVATVLGNRYRPDLDRAGLAGGRCAFLVAMPAVAEDISQVEVRRASVGSNEASVLPVWQRPAKRAPQRATTTDHGLRLRSKGTGWRTYEPVYSDSNLVIFMVPSRSPEVRLLSRAQSSTEARPGLDDRRHLGVRVKRIVLRGADELREIPIDHPDLTRGWWAVERDGQMMSRWTDGEAVLPLPAMHGTVMLEIHLAGSMTYAVDAVPEDERRAVAG